MAQRIVERLRRLGFSENVFGETIAFFAAGETVYVMAMGLKIASENLYGRVFKSSTAYKILKSSSASDISCGICVSLDPIAFYNSIFDKERLVECFKNGICLRSVCDAYIDTSIERVLDGGDFVEVFLRPVRIRVFRRVPRVFTRASAAIVEALVWLTKMPFLRDDERRWAFEFIAMLRETVYRSSSDESHRKVVESIYSSAKRLMEEGNVSR
ncbi:MAG: DUF447 family protein [Ignisphaera sp.]